MPRVRALYVAHLICTTHPTHPSELTLPPVHLILALFVLRGPPRPGPRPPPIPVPYTRSYDFAPLSIYVYDGRDKLQRLAGRRSKDREKRSVRILEDEGGYRLC